MPTEVLTIGPLHELVQNKEYASPAVLCRWEWSGTTPEVSFDKVSWAALAFNNTSFTAPWVRSTATDTILRLLKDQ